MNPLDWYWCHQLVFNQCASRRRAHKVVSDITAERLCNVCWTCGRVWVWT